jgi:hypothetical protein
MNSYSVKGLEELRLNIDTFGSNKYDSRLIGFILGEF